MPLGLPSKKITFPLPYSAKFFTASVHILNKITLVSKFACFISSAAFDIPLATAWRNKATPSPRNKAACFSASADILMAFPSASAALVLVINKAWPSFSAAAFKLFDATTLLILSIMAWSKVMSLICKSCK